MSSFACPLSGLFCHCPNCYIITRCHALCFAVGFQEVNDERVSFLKDQMSPKDKPPVNQARYRLKQMEMLTMKK